MPPIALPSRLAARRPTTVLSRATDETGYVQPSLRDLVAARGPGTAYHLNPITGFRVRSTPSSHGCCWQDELIDADAVIDAATLPRVATPARDRFAPDDRPTSTRVR